MTPLMWAAEKNSDVSMSYLLGAGVDVDAVDSDGFSITF